MPDVYIEDVIAPNYDELLDDVLDHRHSQYLLKGGRGLPTPCAIPFTARWSLPLTSWALTANLSVMFPP